MIDQRQRGRHATVAGIAPARRSRRLSPAALLAIGALLLAGSTARAQWGRETDNVLFPQPDPIPLLIGPEVGYGWWDDKGTFTVSDGDLACTSFRDGKGRGFTVGAKAFIYLNSWFFISPRVRLEQRSGSFETPLPGEPIRGAGDTITTLTENGIVDATFAAAALDATIGVEFFGTGIYIFGGGSGSVLMDGFYDYTTQVTGPSEFIYADTKDVEHRLVQGRSFAGYEKTAIDLRGGLGYLFRMGRFAINPEVFYSMPRTSVLAAPEEMRQTGIVATFGIMYNIGK